MAPEARRIPNKAEKMVTERAGNDVGRKVLASSFANYVDNIRDLDILSGVLVAQGHGRRSLELYNVYARDFTRQQNVDPRFHRLSVFASQFNDESTAIVDVDIKYLSPSQLDQVTASCQEKQIPVTFIPFQASLS